MPARRRTALSGAGLLVLGCARLAAQEPDPPAAGIATAAHRGPARTPALAPEAPRRERAGTAALVLGAGLGLSAWKYYRTPGLQDNDQSFRDAWRDRFTTLDRHRLDDNDFSLNHVVHGLAGRYAYGTARELGVGARGSLLANAVVSSLWEYVVEVREVVSLNDQVVTIVGGSAMGEALHQHGEHLMARRGAGGGLLGAWMLGFPLSGPRVLSRARRPDEGEAAAGTLEGTLRLAHVSARAQGGGARPGVRLRVESAAVNVMGFSEPGRERGFLRGVTLSRLAAEGAVGTADPGQELALTASVAPAGWFAKDVRISAAGARGWRVLAAPVWSYRMATRAAGGIRDRDATVGLAGLGVDATAFLGGPTLRLAGEASVDFAAIRPVAVAEYRARHGLEGTRSVLRSHHYYYGVGTTLEARAVAAAGPVRLRGRLRRQRVASLDGIDREQETLTADVPLRDARTAAEVEGGIALSRRWEVTAGLARRTWRGTMGGMEGERAEREASAGLNLRF